MIYNKSEKAIMKFLKDNNGGMLINEFKQVIAMARSRQEARNKILHLADTIVKHLTLLILFRKNNVEVPTVWIKELKSYFVDIESTWFTNEQVLDIINEIFVDAKKKILIILEEYPVLIYKKIKVKVDEIFEKKQNLKDLGVDFKNDIVHIDGIPIWKNLE